ncbi:uridine 5'-monophosphate synthase [Parasteatoda tepidariorum]|uniref:uridine 5'-monophosphate synthase n=1 Tax=Parasteatoda tepidariorum TaxID=114398 RepID=UPI001C72230D|nr:uridine 5'-monophosphate synthase-like [Parasteatoda tepidariorum]
MVKNEDLLTELLNIDVFKVGNFNLKTGGASPIYIDLRHVIAYPKIARKIVGSIKSKVDELNITMDLVCGVPYTSLPTASVYSVLHDIPLIMKRKEAKSYGTMKLLEGIYKQGDRCLIIEDVVVSGSSIIETARVLRKEGLIVTDCIAVLDRNQGGKVNLPKEGIRYHPLFEVCDMFEKYCDLKEVDDALISKVKEYLSDNNYVPLNPKQCPV